MRENWVGARDRQETIGELAAARRPGHRRVVRPRDLVLKGRRGNFRAISVTLADATSPRATMARILATASPDGV